MMEYKDDDGNVLYGYSQQDMNELVKHQKRNNSLLITLITILFFFFLTLAYTVYRFESGNIIANIVARCVC